MSTVHGAGSWGGSLPLTPRPPPPPPPACACGSGAAAPSPTVRCRARSLGGGLAGPAAVLVLQVDAQGLAAAPLLALIAPLAVDAHARPAALGADVPLPAVGTDGAAPAAFHLALAALPAVVEAPTSGCKRSSQTYVDAFEHRAAFHAILQNRLGRAEVTPMPLPRGGSGLVVGEGRIGHETPHCALFRRFVALEPTEPLIVAVHRCGHLSGSTKNSIVQSCFCTSGNFGTLKKMSEITAFLSLGSPAYWDGVLLTILECSDVPSKTNSKVEGCGPSDRWFQNEFLVRQAFKPQHNGLSPRLRSSKVISSQQ